MAEDGTDFAEAASRACERLLGEPVTGAETGARSRKSVRLQLGGRQVIATRRSGLKRAELEVEVLRALAAQGVRLPEILAFDGTWLIQEDLGARRLSREIRRADDVATESLLDAALTSLAAIHRAGAAAGLETQTYRIGDKPGWISGLIGTSAQLGELLGIPPPALAEDKLIRRLTLPHGAFVKWDARPGNACVLSDGRIAWFDWEHCGCRHRIDDMAWLLGDENVPDIAVMEDRLLARQPRCLR